MPETRDSVSVIRHDTYNLFCERGKYFVY